MNVLKNTYERGIIMVYVFLADGFEEVEALAPVDVLRRAGVEVKTVAIGGDVISGAHGIKVIPDIKENEVSLSDADAIVLPGGLPGTTNLEASAAVQKAIDFCSENEKLLCAICAAPSVFGHKGLLNGKEATAYPSFQSHLEGAKLSEEFVIRDGNFITARGAGVSLEFGAEIASAFVGREKAFAILDSMQRKN